MNRVYRGLLLLALVIFPLSGYCVTDYQQKLRTLIPYSAKENGKLGVYVKSLKGDSVVFGHNESENFIPASNNKIISSYAALSLFGKNYRFKTEFYINREVREGSIQGGLYIKAYGDPSIKTDDLIEIVRGMKSMGIKRIKGNLYFDETYFDNVKYPAGWKTEWVGDYYSPPISAFNLNYNTVKVVVTPLRSGRRPKVEVYPEHYGIRIRNRAITSKKTRGRDLVVKLKSDDKVLNVSGNIDPRDGVQTIEVAVSKPREYFGKVFAKLLKKEGIKFNGRISVRKVPRLSDLFYIHYSDPLYEIINEFNKNSVNIIGEALVKTLGAEFVQSPGTWEDGASVILEFIRKRGLGNRMEIYDGSGLSVYNKVSPKVLAEILALAYYDPNFSREFLSSLPVAGIDGTLKKKFKNSLIEGRVIAKTGYLSGVRALSGYVYAKNGNILVFSVISNGLGSEIKDFHERFLVELLDCCS